MRCCWSATVLLAAAAAAASIACAHDELRVPSIGFHALALGGDTARALQTHGVVTLAGVPGYAALRRDFLRAAAECVWRRRAPDARSGVLYRKLADGTERFTISAVGGADGLEATDCPAYQQRKQLFGDVVTRALDQFSAAFDKSANATASGGAKLREVMSEARMMDHFHAYVPAPHVDATSCQAAGSDADAAAQQARTASRDRALALNMHSDSGLFIAMSAPMFFEVAPGEDTLREIANPDPDSGLLIKLEDGSVVRPVQPEDELTVMVGDGFSTWVQLPVEIPAVVHGMLMPQTCRNGAQVVRSWFGKMVLLSESATMANTGMEFAAYSRQLVESVESGSAFPAHFAAVACPAQRRLEENACSYRVCHPFTPLATPEQCTFWCNTHTMDADHDFASDCQKNCICAHHPVKDHTFSCWMSCFETDTKCAGEQTCESKRLGDITIASRVCKSAGSNASTAATKHHKVHVRVKVAAPGAEQQADVTDSAV